MVDWGKDDIGADSQLGAKAGNGEPAAPAITWGKGDIGADSQLAAPDVTQAPPVMIQERVRNTLGLDPEYDRAALLPIARDAEGEMRGAWPQAAIDMVQGFMLPGHVAQGGGYTMEDAVKFGLDFAVPASTAGRLTPRGVRGRDIQSRARSADEVIENAPSQQELLNVTDVAGKGAKGTGLVVDSDSYMTWLNGVRADLDDTPYDGRLHPQLRSALDAMEGQAGKPLDMNRLQIARDQLSPALGTFDNPQQRRLAMQVKEKLDEFIEGLGPDDLAEGTAANVDEALALLKTHRSAYNRFKKAERIEEIIEAAKSQASGFENGIRIGFRALLKEIRQGKNKNYSPDEIALMKQIERGDNITRALRALSKLALDRSGSTNFLGASIGAAAGAGIGSAVGGPVGASIGAMLPPIAGHIASRAATGRQRTQATLARALAASGQRPPITADPGGRLLAEMLRRGVPITAGTQIPQNPNDGSM